MPSAQAVDPNRATLLAILKQLNQAAALHETEPDEQGMELREVETALADFAPVKKGTAKISLVLGLLLRNGMIEAQAPKEYSYHRQRSLAHRYQITAEGKRFLASSIETSDRIG